MRQGLELGFDEWGLIHLPIVEPKIEVFKLLFLES